MAGLDAPDFIAECPIGDYYEIGSYIWRAIYKKERQNAQVFKEDIWEDSGDSVFIINLKYISADQQKPFIDLVDQALSAKQLDPQANTKDLEKQIDDIVYQLYGLTDEEIKIVEEGVKEIDSQRDVSEGEKTNGGEL